MNIIYKVVNYIKQKWYSLRICSRKKQKIDNESFNESFNEIKIVYGDPSLEEVKTYAQSYGATPYSVNYDRLSYVKLNELISTHIWHMKNALEFIRLTMKCPHNNILWLNCIFCGHIRHSVTIDRKFLLYALLFPLTHVHYFYKKYNKITLLFTYNTMRESDNKHINYLNPIANKIFKFYEMYLQLNINDVTLDVYKQVVEEYRKVFEGNFSTMHELNNKMEYNKLDRLSYIYKSCQSHETRINIDTSTTTTNTNTTDINTNTNTIDIHVDAFKPKCFRTELIEKYSKIEIPSPNLREYYEANDGWLM